jgi:hypothetical protein
MCVFCAAVPATLAVGASLSAKQLNEKRNAEERGESPQEKRKIHAGKVTVIAAGTLVVASAVYHSQFSG